MFPEKSARAPLPVRPAALTALVAVSTLTFALSVLLALAPATFGLPPNVLGRLQWLNLALSGSVLALLAVASWAAWRRRARELNALITVCAWTQRVYWQGRWMSFEEYLAKRFHLRCTHGICDEAAKQMKDQAAQLSLQFHNDPS